MKPVHEWVRSRLNKPDLEPNPPTEESEPKTLNLKFHIFESQEDLDPAIADFQQGWSMLFINMTPISDKKIYLKTLVSRLQREAQKAGGRLSAFGEGWLLMAPKDVSIEKVIKKEMIGKEIMD
ncbi:MAG: hypothetical protein KJ709_06125 [Nanoarchaeota archaeon]|nr:hypothetical protein [Nanoarchaeota archaeon]